MRAESATAPLIVSGDGEGLVDLAAIGALDGRNVILYSGVVRRRRRVGCATRSRSDGATLVVTDTNRKRGRRWGVIRDVEGATERVDETALADDEGDARLEVFPDAPSDAFTVVESPGARVSTSRYGNVITYWPEMPRRACARRERRDRVAGRRPCTGDRRDAADRPRRADYD